MSLYPYTKNTGLPPEAVHSSGVVNLKYHYYRLVEEVAAVTKRVAWKRAGLHLSYARPENAPIKIPFNQGAPINFADAQILSKASDANCFVFQVPTERCVWGYGWRYSTEESPYSLFYRDPQFLRNFYDHYRPNTLSEALTLDYSIPRVEPSVKLDQELKPTLLRAARSSKHGIDKAEGCNLSGPISEQALLLEQERLRYVRASIETRGWQPEKHEGYIRGFFLFHRGDFLFRVFAGRHRAAALADLGWKSLPAIFDPYEPRYVAALTPEDEPLLDLYFSESLRGVRRNFLESCRSSAFAPAVSNEGSACA